MDREVAREEGSSVDQFEWKWHVKKWRLILLMKFQMATHAQEPVVGPFHISENLPVA